MFLLRGTVGYSFKAFPLARPELGRPYVSIYDFRQSKHKLLEADNRETL